MRTSCTSSSSSHLGQLDLLVSLGPALRAIGANVAIGLGFGRLLRSDAARTVSHDIRLSCAKISVRLFLRVTYGKFGRRREEARAADHAELPRRNNKARLTASTEKGTVTRR